MAYSPGKNALKKKQTKPSLLKGIHSRWLQIWPVLLFGLGFASLMILFYVVWLSDYFQNSIHPHIISVNARLSSFILNLFGMGTSTMNAMISSSSFSVDIARGCDGVEAMALYASALLSFRGTWRYKLAGFFGGIAILFTLNIVRIISLFLTGIYFPKFFEIMHVEVWQVLFIIFAIGLFGLWIWWSGKGESHAA